VPSSDVVAEIFVVFLGWGRKRPIFFLNGCETLYPALKVGNFKIRGVDKSTPGISALDPLGKGLSSQSRCLS